MVTPPDWASTPLLVGLAAENDVDGVESPAILLPAVSNGCFNGESDLAGIEGTGASARGGKLFEGLAWAGLVAAGEVWKIPLGGKLGFPDVRSPALGEDGFVKVEYALDLVGDWFGGES